MEKNPTYQVLSSRQTLCSLRKGCPFCLTFLLSILLTDEVSAESALIDKNTNASRDHHTKIIL